MAKCSVCGNKVSFWSVYNDDGKDYCKECWKKKEEKLEKMKIKEEEDRKRKYEEEANQVQEYKRKCNQCGKVWHSSVKREKQLARGSFLDALVGVGTAVTGNLGASTQSSRNTDAQVDSLDKMRKCPNCGSTDYKEEIISFKRKT